MPRDPEPDLDTPGLAGGPGPTPPGLADNVPRVNPTPPEDPGAAAAQQEHADVAERSAGTRGADIDEEAGERGPDRGEPGE